MSDTLLESMLESFKASNDPAEKEASASEEALKKYFYSDCTQLKAEVSHPPPHLARFN